MPILQKKIYFLLLLSVFFSYILFFNKTQVNAQQSTTNCNVSSSLLIQTSAELNLLSLINTYRQQNNLPALIWSQGLKKPAAWLSNDLSSHNTFSHTDSLGRDPATRITQCGYIWTSYAENIYMGSNDPQAVFTAWKNSPVHNANMLNTNVKEAGISDVNTYWTLDFGSTNSTVPTIPPITSSPTITQSLTPTGTPTGTQQPTSTPSTTPSPTPGIITNLTDTKVDVSIRINGVGAAGNKSPKHLTRFVSIGIYDQSNKLVLNGNGFLKYDGSDLFRGIIHLGQLANDIYMIKVASNYTLVSLMIPQFQNLTSESINVLPVVPLTQGDLNTNNVIDINDYNLALPCFQNKSCETKNIIDFNDDGKADVIDYNLLLSAYHQYEGD